MKSIYISGAITGMKDNNKKAFELAEKHFAEKKFKVVNPLKIDHSNAKCYEDYLKKDIKHLLDCDYIYMLLGHEKSKGAMIELDLARKLGIAVMFEN